MTASRTFLFNLPGVAFAKHATSGRTVAIFRGGSSHYGVVTTKTAEELNTIYGVSPAQAKAMLAGRVHGWHALLADPEQYDSAGNPLHIPK